MRFRVISHAVMAGQKHHLYLDARVDEETLKKVVLHSVATALASMVLPVPGGPNINTPCICTSSCDMSNLDQAACAQVNGHWLSEVRSLQNFRCQH